MIFSISERERLIVLIDEAAAQSEAATYMKAATEAEKAVGARDSELLRRLARRIESES